MKRWKPIEQLIENGEKLWKEDLEIGEKLVRPW